MRVLAPLAAVVLLASACPSFLAPPATSGAREGARCSANVDCASGLVCECGSCAKPTGMPSRCLALDDACGDEPSDCFRACGDPSVVGKAACVGGRESCSSSGGVLESSCPPETCWEPPGPGEVCVDGELQCEHGRAANGQCYTDDCEGSPRECVSACADGSEPFSEVCLASQWQCEGGLPIEGCGECVGALPACVLSCSTLEPVGSAACSAELEWSCAHILQDGRAASVITDCCDENPDACPDPSEDAGPGDDDAGGVDAGEPDAGTVDTGSGAVDGGDSVPLDGGPEDAGEGDAG